MRAAEEPGHGASCSSTRSPSSLLRVTEPRSIGSTSLVNIDVDLEQLAALHLDRQRLCFERGNLNQAYSTSLANVLAAIFAPVLPVHATRGLGGTANVSCSLCRRHGRSDLARHLPIDHVLVSDYEQEWIADLQLQLRQCPRCSLPNAEHEGHLVSYNDLGMHIISIGKKKVLSQLFQNFFLVVSIAKGSYLPFQAMKKIKNFRRACPGDLGGSPLGTGCGLGPPPQPPHTEILGPPLTSWKTDAVSANLFKVLSTIKQTPVFSICRTSLFSLSPLSLSLPHSSCS